MLQKQGGGHVAEEKDGRRDWEGGPCGHGKNFGFYSE